MMLFVIPWASSLSLQLSEGVWVHVAGIPVLLPFLALPSRDSPHPPSPPTPHHPPYTHPLQPACGSAILRVRA